jgi:hypothetical protein
MDAPSLDNQSEFEVLPRMLLHKSGERLVVVVKATFLLSRESSALPLAPPELARPIRMADEMWEKPEVESVKYPSDLCCYKPGTDVIGVVTAFAPGGQPVPQFDTYLRVGHLNKAVRVSGLRVWEARGAGVSAPRPIAALDLRYDFAFGGRDDSDPARFVEEAQNPVGRGVARDAASLTHALAPQLEDPGDPVRSASQRPVPASYGAIGRSYAPRRAWTGTYDGNWKEFRAPLPPSDEDDRFHQAASPALIATPPLAGGEACALLNLMPDGPMQFVLPRVRVEVVFDVRGRQPERLVPHLDTVLIDTWNVGPEKPPVLELVWRASIKAPRKMRDARIVVSEEEAS